MPANTRGCTCLKPGSASVACARSSVVVSPTGAPSISLMPPMTKPTSPGLSEAAGTDLGVNRPTLSTRCARPVDMTRIFSPALVVPLTTRTSVTTPT